MNSPSMLINVLTSPIEAMKALQEKPRFLLPLILIPLVFIVYQIVYFSVVDFPWLLEQIALQAELKGGDPSQADAIKNIPKNLMMIPGIIFGTLMIIFTQVIYAAYLLLVSKVRGDQLGFKSLFSLSLWCSLPFIFTFIACMVNVLLADGGRVFIDAANPFSLNSLIFDLSLESPWRGLLVQLDVFLIWALVLLTLGYQQFSQRSRVQSAITVLAPYLVIYGIWSLVIVL